MGEIYDTYKSAEEFNCFVYNGCPEGFIIIAACQDDCVTQLSSFAKAWFQAMGSKEIANLEFRQGWAFIGQIGAAEANEARAKTPEEVASIT